MKKIEKFEELSNVCGFDIDSNSCITLEYNPHNTINATSNITLEEMIEDLLNKKTRQIITEYKCHNCGGSLNIPNDKHVMICPYCNSVYAYGLQMINDRG